jgi:NTP pyrophosphatase (non-canonical NTP hydrolase)
MAVGAAIMHDKTVNLQTLKDMVRVFVQDRNWTEGHSPKNLAMSISIEAAELMEVFQSLTGQTGKLMSYGRRRRKTE